MDEGKIMKILNKYEGTMRKAGAFLIEVEENEVIITDSCEGIDLVPLNRELCGQLSKLFQELGEAL